MQILQKECNKKGWKDVSNTFQNETFGPIKFLEPSTDQYGS